MPPSALPDGDPAPPDGSLPVQVAEGASDRALGVYLHVPFCARLCHYCDFNRVSSAPMRSRRSRSSCSMSEGLARVVVT